MAIRVSEAEREIQSNQEGKQMPNCFPSCLCHGPIPAQSYQNFGDFFFPNIQYIQKHSQTHTLTSMNTRKQSYSYKHLLETTWNSTSHGAKAEALTAYFSILGTKILHRLGTSISIGMVKTCPCLLSSPHFT